MVEKEDTNKKVPDAIIKMEHEGLKQALAAKRFVVTKVFCSEPGSKEWEELINGWRANIRKIKVFEQDNYTCKKCGATAQYLVRGKNTGQKNTPTGTIQFVANNLELLTVDHIVPYSISKSNKIENLQTLCYKCNNQKGDSIDDEAIDTDIKKEIIKKIKHNVAKVFRDEIAISMPWETIPELDPHTMLDVYKRLSIPYDLSNPLSMIEAQLKYQAIIRYLYADEMLKIKSK